MNFFAFNKEIVSFLFNKVSLLPKPNKDALVRATQRRFAVQSVSFSPIFLSDFSRN